MTSGGFRAGVSLAPYTTLKAGGAAERFGQMRRVDELASALIVAQMAGLPTTVLGWGSNVLPSDAGVPGLTLLNQTREIEFGAAGRMVVDSGCALQDVFLRATQRGLVGLQFAVGIPGSVGGAMVSNAGAYRSSIAEFVTRVEIVAEGRREWVEPAWMEFSYRDSRLRRTGPLPAAIVRVELTLPTGDPARAFAEARVNQQQRIGKQPPGPSAGSFFKNVNDVCLAERLPGLPGGLRAAGVVPAGYLIEAAGLKGYRHGGAMLGVRHANFILNVGGATATEIRSLAEVGQRVVRDHFGVDLEPEVLYLGDWSGFTPTPG